MPRVVLVLKPDISTRLTVKEKDRKLDQGIISRASPIRSLLYAALF